MKFSSTSCLYARARSSCIGTVVSNRATFTFVASMAALCWSIRCWAASTWARYSANWSRKRCCWRATNRGSVPFGAAKLGFPASSARSRTASTWADRYSFNRRFCSAPVTVGSSSISTSPFFTACPSRTWIARMTPLSSGWITFECPLGMILPGATATMSIWPTLAHRIPTANTPIIVPPTARPTGDGGAS